MTCLLVSLEENHCLVCRYVIQRLGVNSCVFNLTGCPCPPRSRTTQRKRSFHVAIEPAVVCEEERLILLRSAIVASHHTVMNPSSINCLIEAMHQNKYSIGKSSTNAHASAITPMSHICNYAHVMPCSSAHLQFSPSICKSAHLH
ncbi:hypothetical protein K501DRAFT_276976 [Backusella circina FSU 941]|nr:hypothetical protein K501DRAFT_276976 [Backusella circina FSU 941]